MASTSTAVADTTSPSLTSSVSPGALVAEELGRLSKLMQSFKAHSAPAPGGLEWSTYMVLLHLVKHGPQRSKALAVLLHSDPSTISRQASALVDLGLVDRETDPQDRRAVRLAATAAGRRLFDEVRAQRVRLLDLVLSDWAPDDVRDLAELMGRFNHDFEAHLVGAHATDTSAAHSTDPPEHHAHGSPPGTHRSTLSSTATAQTQTQQEMT